MELDTLRVGAILHGAAYDYRVERVLGQGSFGITYLASLKIKGALGTIDSNVYVAIKEFYMRDVNGRNGASVTFGSQAGLFIDYKKKFEKEARNLSKLQHKNIVKVIELFEANNTIYYSMEYCAGGSLDELIYKNQRLSLQKTISIAQEIGAALSYMHSLGFYHLDLKPANVMMRQNGDIALIDFGLSKSFNANGVPESSTTIGGGTPGYAPLEQSNYSDSGSAPVTMDVYALGGTIFKMLTGKKPPLAASILNEGFPFGEFIALSGTSTEVTQSIEKAMEPMKKKRYQTVSEFIAVFSNFDTMSGGTKRYESQYVDKTETDDEDVLEGTEIIDSPYTFPTNINGLDIKWCNGISKNRVKTISKYIEAMVLIQGGIFTMGSNMVGAYSDETEHVVKLSDFGICRYQVTQELWEAVMGSNPSFFKDPLLPVEQVSYEDCKVFLQRLNEITGILFRLPTESEWEYAARGGNKRSTNIYSGSMDIDAVSWNDANSNNTTHRVGLKAPNVLGLYDMSGNVLEWCYDAYDTYPKNAVNPSGPKKGLLRVCRGGCWCSPARTHRVSCRNYYKSNVKFNYLGLRLAL